MKKVSKTKTDAVLQKLTAHDKRFDMVDKKFEAIDKRFDVVDKKFEAIDKRFDVVDKKFEAIDKRFEYVDKRFDTVDKRFDKLDRDFGDFKMQVFTGQDEILTILRRLDEERIFTTTWVTRIEKEVEIHRQEIGRIKKELKIN